MSPFRLVAVALAAIAFAIAVPSSASALTYGVVQGDTVLPADAELDALQASGARAVKIFTTWSAIEKADGAPYETGTLAALASITRAYAGRGIAPTIVFFGGESWLAPNPEVANVTPPRSHERFARALAALAQHLAGTTGALPITYTVWNEADEAVFWQPGPDVAAYTALLRATYPAVKQADPQARVALTPLTAGNWRFLQGVYDRGGRDSFDAVPVDLGTACSIVSPTHYVRDPADNSLLSQTSFLAYREVRKTMLANGDGHKPLLNEIGWSVAQGATSCNQGAEAGRKPGGVTEAEQAHFLREAHHCMLEDPYVETAFWFEYKDRGDDPFNPDHRFGLLRRDGTPRPAHAAFSQVAQGIDAIGGPCGDFVPPAITVIRPQPGERYADKIDIQVRANDPSQVARITLAFDGANEIRNFTGSDVGNDRVVGLTPWFKSQELALGPHTISFIALDGFGNQSRVDVPVEKVSEAALPADVAARFALGRRVTCRKGNRRARSAKGRRPLCTLKGRIVKPTDGPSLGGKVLAQWQWYSPPKPKRKGVRKKAIKGGWKTLHKVRKPANKAFTLNQRMAKRGGWRLRVTYEAVRPYKRMVARDVRFRVR